MMLWLYVHSIKEFSDFEEVKTIVILVKEEICAYSKSVLPKTAKYPSRSTTKVSFLGTEIWLQDEQL